MKTLSKASLALLLLLSLAACATPQADPMPEEPMMEDDTNMEDTTMMNEDEMMLAEGVEVHPISHATAVLKWDDMVIYSDPTGGAEAFAGQPAPNLAFVTDIHGDHMSAETLEAVLADDTVLLVPQAVADELPQDLTDNWVILANGQTTEWEGFTIEAVPMYNLPVAEDSRHTKGRGNGYVFEKDGLRVYFSGDTADIPEMRALQDIDVAFVCMNLPYTMSVEDAADAVLEFKPAKVYPYHYRGQEGLSDVAEFKRLVNAGDPNIEVVQLEWYPE